MEWIRRFHLYLGCLFAPALIFFAVSGTWQLYRLHDTKEDGSYVAPRPLEILSAVHMDSHLPGKKAAAYTPFRTFSTLAAIGLVLSTLLGVVMAFRFSRNALTPLICLFSGVAIPLTILYIYR